MAASGASWSPPSEKLSGVTLITPTITGRSMARPRMAARGADRRSSTAAAPCESASSAHAATSATGAIAPVSPPGSRTYTSHAVKTKRPPARRRPAPEARAASAAAPDTRAVGRR